MWAEGEEMRLCAIFGNVLIRIRPVPSDRLTWMGRIPDRLDALGSILRSALDSCQCNVFTFKNLSTDSLHPETVNKAHLADQPMFIPRCIEATEACWWPKSEKRSNQSLFFKERHARTATATWTGCMQPGTRTWNALEAGYDEGTRCPASDPQHPMSVF